MATSPIGHIVVLMLENRAFDHMLGFLPRTGALKDYEGLTGTEFNLLDPSNPSSKKFTVGQNAPYKITHGWGPGHSFDAANVQSAANKAGPGHPAAMNGFVASYHNELIADTIAAPSDADIQVVMESFTPALMPTISTLAQEFVLCDHWFSSVPGPTQPNRLYMHAATSAGYAYNDWGHEFHFRTIYNHLEDAGHSWAIYYSNDNEGLKFSQLDKDHMRFRLFEKRFVSDVQSGKLPEYSFIVPRFTGNGVVGANSEHAPLDVRFGEHLIALVYEVLRGQQNVWEQCLFILTYDEHGGFYDHVAPPTNVPNPDGLNSPQRKQASYAPTFGFTRLGVRVPTILVSPWLAPGLDQTVYEHTSILSTLKEFHNLPRYLTKRDEASNSFAQMLQGQLSLRTDTPDKLPVPPPPGDDEVTAQGAAPLDPVQRDILKGTVNLHPDPRQRQPQEILGIDTQKQASDYMDQKVKNFIDHHVAQKG